MAESLINAMKSKFDPAKFKDQYSIALKKVIQAKLKGTEIKQSEPRKPTAVTDLMQALQDSIAKAQKGSSSTHTESTSDKGRKAISPTRPRRARGAA